MTFIWKCHENSVTSHENIHFYPFLMYESYKEHEAQCLVQDREDDQSGSWLRLGHRLEDAGICECL
jgi:hypothetical protein